MDGGVMAASIRTSRAYRVFQLIVVDLIFSLFVAWLIVDSPRRWPVLIVFVPLFLLANLYRLNWIRRDRPPTISGLAVIYSCGFLFGVIWTIAQFAWWKIPLLAVPLVLALYHWKRFQALRTKS
ncbi:MAG: hypothetical protein ACLGSD_07080 [Acidobacteriota bacterium]